MNAVEHRIEVERYCVTQLLLLRCADESSLVAKNAEFTCVFLLFKLTYGRGVKALLSKQTRKPEG